MTNQKIKEEFINKLVDKIDHQKKIRREAKEIEEDVAIVMSCIDEFNKLRHREEFFINWGVWTEDINIPACFASLIDPDSIKVNPGEYRCKDMKKIRSFMRDAKLIYHKAKFDTIVSLDHISKIKYDAAIERLANTIRENALPMKSLKSLRTEDALFDRINDAELGGYVADRVLANGTINIKEIPVVIDDSIKDALFDNVYIIDVRHIYDAWLDNFSLMNT